MNTELKDLLTLAAKACGYEVVDLANSGFYIKHTDGQLSTAVWWAPHLDDGDGARMEAKLHLSSGFRETYAVAYVSHINNYGRRVHVLRVEAYADHNGDKQAARRWASLRAAAQIGKGVNT